MVKPGGQICPHSCSQFAWCPALNYHKCSISGNTLNHTLKMTLSLSKEQLFPSYINLPLSFSSLLFGGSHVISTKNNYTNVIMKLRRAFFINYGKHFHISAAFESVLFTLFIPQEFFSENIAIRDKINYSIGQKNFTHNF